MTAPSRAGVAVLGILITAALLAPVARATGPLPACRYDDVLTTPRSYDDWAITLVDTILSVPASYVPPDLAPVARAGFESGGRVRALMLGDLRAMRVAAAAAGAAIEVRSAYRSYAHQAELFREWVDRYGYERALKVPARPGHSEHQLGLAIDFRSAEPGSTSDDFKSTRAGRWMGSHAWRYGFISSYPAGARSVTCYVAEAWHFRYVGRELAAQIHESGLTQREYLWATFTTTIVPPAGPQTDQARESAAAVNAAAMLASRPGRLPEARAVVPIRVSAPILRPPPRRALAEAAADAAADAELARAALLGAAGVAAGLVPVAWLVRRRRSESPR